MSTQMESSLHLISIATFLLLLLLSTTNTAATTATDFIRTNCNDTSYPALCYTTLSRHAHCVQNNKALLAKSAIIISLKKTKATANYVTRLNKTSTPEFIELSPVLDDCVNTLMDAADLARDSVKQMKEIVSVNSGGFKDDESVRFKVGDIQTWMSAALSNQVTCIDGFDDVVDGLVKGDVVKRVEVAKMVTSNALALVNKFVNG